MKSPKEPQKIQSLDLTKGFSWYAVIKIGNQKRNGRKVVFEAAQTNSLVRVTLGLDTENSFCIWIRDSEGKEVSSDPLPSHLFFNKFVLLSAEVVPEGQRQVLLRAGVNNESFMSKEVELGLGAPGSARFSLGASVDEKDHAAFELAELMLYSSTQNEDEKAKLRKYVRQEFSF
jgi:hypothetical protein